MKDFTKIKLQFILYFILIIALILGIIFLFKKTKLKMNEYIKDKEEFFSLQKKVSSFDVQEKKYKKISPFLSKIENSFFSIKEGEIKNKKISEFFKNIEEGGKKEGVDVKIKNLTEPTQKDNFYLFELEVSGSFVNILRFLFFIENTPTKNYYLIEVKKIELSRVVSGECTGGDSENCQEKRQKIEVNGTIEFKIFSKK